MRASRRLAGTTFSVLLTVALLTLGIGLIAGGTQLALGVVATMWGVWNVFVALVVQRGSEHLITSTVLLRPFAMGTFLLALAAVIFAGKQSLGWIVILPIGIGWLALGVWLLWAYGRQARRRQ